MTETPEAPVEEPVDETAEETEEGGEVTTEEEAPDPSTGYGRAWGVGPPW